MNLDGLDGYQEAVNILFAEKDKEVKSALDAYPHRISSSERLKRIYAANRKLKAGLATLNEQFLSEEKETRR